VVLAVSGGRDSMVLLHAAARVLSPEHTIVATFDHATGAFAERAAAMVARESGWLGLAVVTGRASGNAGSEAGWRAARHGFLADVARRFGARVMTAHTRDDQVETVLMRLLRGSGARGLAGLYAPTQLLRPLLQFSRDVVADYARAQGIRWVEDPTNRSPAFLRNRVRRDLLPALTRADPALDRVLLQASRRAAALRGRLDRWVDGVARVAPDGRAVRVPAVELAGHDEEQLALLWPALAARVGLAMDWRGTVRAAAFTTQGRVGAFIPLTGGWRLSRDRDVFELYQVPEAPPLETALVPGLKWLDWTFRAASEAQETSDAWVALLPAGRQLRVRCWQAGDRMRAGGLMRRVKRHLSDAGITGERRARWPVVLAGDEIVWIPGVRRSDAASVRPGRPGVLYRCDHDSR
jgi:tRNA(Ile)-lysidine synthase